MTVMANDQLNANQPRMAPEAAPDVEATPERSAGRDRRLVVRDRRARRAQGSGASSAAEESPSDPSVNAESVPPREATAVASPQAPASDPFAAAEAYNRAHVVDVVRFDRATGGRFAKGNGELDAAGVARFQAEHGLPSDGRVDENTCLVAEGKPPIPIGPQFQGPPTLSIEHPTGENFPPGVPIPLTLSLAAPPPTTFRGTVTVRPAFSGPIHQQRTVEAQIGGDGHATLDLEIAPVSVPPRLGVFPFIVEVSGDAGGQAVASRSNFEILTLGGLLPSPSLGPEPAIPGPAPAGDSIDQPAAETFNRAHVSEVVRFDHATHGAYAKPNGELDALRVAEFQRESGLPITGEVDDTTVAAAERTGGHLDPGGVPDSHTPEPVHGPPTAFVAFPKATQVVKAGVPLVVKASTRPSTPIEMSWTLFDGFRIPIDSGFVRSTVDDKGNVALVDFFRVPPIGLDTGQVCMLEIAVTGVLGAAELILHPVILG
jgi:hypothetical protein